MKRIVCFLLLITISVNFASADLITPFSENNSIDVINGEIWVTAHLDAPHITRKGYIFRFNPNTNKWKLHSFSSPIISITHSDSTVWLGTYGKGILRYKDGKWKRFTAYNTGSGCIGQKDGLIDNYVNNIVADKQHLYCATVRGLSIYNHVQNEWISFDPKNSILPTPYIFDLDKKGDKLWLVNSNYWFVYYEPFPMGDEKGSIVYYDVSNNNWKSFSGRRKKFTSDTTFIKLKGEIPSPNSDFSNIAVNGSGDVWFSFQGGVGVFKKGDWKVYTKLTSGVDFGYVSDIAVGKLGVWVASEKGLFQYKGRDDTWILHEKGSDKIPGTVITSIYVSDSSVWVKSYDPNFWEKQGLSDAPSHGKNLKKGIFHRLNIDGNIVDVKCMNKERWQELYNPGYMEFLTVYKNGKWQSWELTRRLISELTK